MHTYICTHITYIQTSMQTYTYKSTAYLSYVHTYLYTCLHKYTNNIHRTKHAASQQIRSHHITLNHITWHYRILRLQSHMHHTHAYIHDTHTLNRIRTHIHTLMHALHTYIHTNMHAHMLSCIDIYCLTLQYIHQCIHAYKQTWINP